MLLFSKFPFFEGGFKGLSGCGISWRFFLPEFELLTVIYLPLESPRPRWGTASFSRTKADSPSPCTLAGL